MPKRKSAPYGSELAAVDAEAEGKEEPLHTDVEVDSEAALAALRVSGPIRRLAAPASHGPDTLGRVLIQQQVLCLSLRAGAVELDAPKPPVVLPGAALRWCSWSFSSARAALSWPERLSCRSLR
jgi:hypothetical protein